MTPNPPEPRVWLSRADVMAAAQAGEITPQQAERLWARWSAAKAAPHPPAIAAPRFDFTHTLYYLGGLLAIGAMTLFMTLGWNLFGPWGVLALAVGYAVAALAVTQHLLRQGLRTPAGLLATLAA